MFSTHHQKILNFSVAFILSSAIAFNSVLSQTSPWVLCVCSTSLSKTMWEKEKLLVTNNFCFSHNIFYPFKELSTFFIKYEIVIYILFHFGKVENLSFGTGLTHHQTMPHFDALKIYSCGKHCEKRRNCLQQAISPFLTMFSTLALNFHFKCTLKCHLQLVSI